MSRISEYQAALRRKAKDREKQTVADFAKELHKSPDTMLMQLREAGVAKSSETDKLGAADKQKLLKRLQDQHKSSSPRKRITITVDPIERRLARAVAEGANGAEFEVLELVMGSVLWGHPLPPSLQKLANIVVAKSVLVGMLPLRKLGRPKQKGLDETGHHAAWRYFNLVDAGLKYQDAVEMVASEICKSERHVMRLIAKHKTSIGDTVEERESKRRFYQMQRELHGDSQLTSIFDNLLKPEIPIPELTVGDCLDHLDELASQLAAKAKPLTKKI